MTADEHATSNVPEEWQGLPDSELDDLELTEEERHGAGTALTGNRQPDVDRMTVRKWAGKR